MLGAEVSAVTGNLATHIAERADAEGDQKPVTSDDEANLLFHFADGPVTSGATGA